MIRGCADDERFRLPRADSPERSRRAGKAQCGQHFPADISARAQARQHGRPRAIAVLSQNNLARCSGTGKTHRAENASDQRRRRRESSPIGRTACPPARRSAPASHPRRMRTDLPRTRREQAHRLGHELFPLDAGHCQRPRRFKRRLFIRCPVTRGTATRASRRGAQPDGKMQRIRATT